MTIIPVLDVLRGQVVRGVGGRRDEYRPVVSCLTTSAAPLDVARAFRDCFGYTLLYVADLDAILGAAPSLTLYRLLRDDGFQLWVDAGVRHADDADPLADSAVAGIVAGLETLAGPDALCELIRRHGAERLIFSLDLNGGRPLGNTSAWGAEEACEIAAAAVAAGVRRIIVLDLACVGMRRGTGTEELCRWIAARYPDVALIAGGGVRGRSDVERLHNCGVQGVLVASALHDGSLVGGVL